jgi:hypothetical protein
MTAQEFMDKLTPQYVAGFFDGEGFVHSSTDKRGILIMKVGIAQKRPEIIVALLAMFPSGCFQAYKTKGAKCHSITWNGVNAHDFLKYIQPYVVLKKPQVDLALEYASLGYGDHGKFILSARIKAINQTNSAYGKEN